MNRVQREIAQAVRRHPAGSDDLARPGIGVRRVELRPAQEVQVVGGGRLDGVPTTVVGTVEIPAVHVLECIGCGCLLAIGSPLVAKHHLQHREQARGGPGKRARRWMRRMSALTWAHARAAVNR